MMNDVLASTQSLPGAIATLYGPVECTDRRAIHVYTDGSYFKLPDGSERAGAGIYWGYGSPKNCALMVPTPVSNNRAELYAILRAITVADPCRTLRIHTDSTYAIHSICHWAPRNSALGWRKANGDLLRNIVDLIKRRTAAVVFIWVKGHSGNASNEAADELAGWGASMQGPLLPFVPVVAEWGASSCPGINTEGQQGETMYLKVHTALPEQNAPRPEAQAGTASSLVAVHSDDDDRSPEGFNLRQLRERHIRDLLENGRADASFWKTYRGLVDPRPRNPRVTAAQLQVAFEPRMNPPSTLPEHWDPTRHRINRMLLDSLPQPTVDSTEQQYFARPWAVSEIEDAKAHILEHSLGSAKGLDRVAYEEVLRVPNEELLRLFQTCVDTCDAPTSWLVASLTGIGKRGKDLGEADNYRAVGLESCMLKMLTLLIERRVRQWAEQNGHLPMSQNGFRTGHRTNNNAFVLRAAIEKARARGKQLYVAFVDLSNAFPSVDQATLWTKLYTAGFRGPLFDWLRMLYARLGYVVKYASSKSELFKALAGILIGDPASPILWNLYLADLVIRPHSDDILLGGVCLSHLEQADDIALFSTSTIALQQKLDDLATWCALNFALINAGKTQVMVFGRTGAATLGGPPRLYVNGRLIAVVESYTYVGTVFSSGRGDLFGPHTDSKASTARKVANACLSVEAYVAELPPWAALTLYQSHVDPHLTGGAEVAPYVRLSSLTLLESVQHIYLRRMLGLNPRAMTTPLFTETGLWPIRYRRLALALRFALYIISQRPPVPLAALAEARAMAIAGADSWLGDLHHALQSLPVPVEMDKHAALTDDYISNMLERLRISLVEHLRQEIASSQRLVMLAARASREPVLERRDYLSITRREHRAALIRLLVSDHPLAVEQMRRRTPPVPREWRVCRFCARRGSIEDETHTLLRCPGAALVEPRKRFMAQVLSVRTSLRVSLATTPLAFLAEVTRDADAVTHLAEYVHTVFLLCENVPMVVITSEEQLLQLS